MSRGPNYIALAIPFFFLLIVAELLIERRRKQAWYRFSDAVTNIGCGVTSQVVNLFFRGALLWGYVWVYNNYRLVDLGASPVLAWIVALVGVDFLYYWWHRASHEVNLFWAAHIVHHQSDDYNFAVALRQAVLTAYTVAPFYLPLALLGVPPLLYGVSVSISTLYQFWIHTEAVRKLGPLELVLNTPSHHRVHQDGAVYGAWVAGAGAAGAVLLGLWAIWLPKAPAPRDTPIEEKVWQLAPKCDEV